MSFIQKLCSCNFQTCSLIWRCLVSSISKLLFCLRISTAFILAYILTISTCTFSKPFTVTRFPLYQNRAIFTAFRDCSLVVVCTVEPRNNEPRYNEDPVITNNISKPDRITVKYEETSPTITNSAITKSPLYNELITYICPVALSQ